jgi:hypothetical protein
MILARGGVHSTSRCLPRVCAREDFAAFPTYSGLCAGGPSENDYNEADAQVNATAGFARSNIGIEPYCRNPEFLSGC